MGMCVVLDYVFSKLYYQVRSLMERWTIWFKNGKKSLKITFFVLYDFVEKSEVEEFQCKPGLYNSTVAKEQWKTFTRKIQFIFKPLVGRHVTISQL